jgi:hypothetical protein
MKLYMDYLIILIDFGFRKEVKLRIGNACVLLKKIIIAYISVLISCSFTK